MKVGIHAAVVDSDTQALATAITPVFDALGRALEGEYGGSVEHLWIDLELLAYLANEDGSARYPFRFQKRVSGRSRFGLPTVADSFNVAHFSVRPDFALLASLPVEESIGHVLERIYQESMVLLDKQKKLGGFNAGLFLERLLIECQRLGYTFPAK